MSVIGQWGFDDTVAESDWTAGGGNLGGTGGRTGVGGVYFSGSANNLTLPIPARSSMIFATGLMTSNLTSTGSFIQLREGTTTHLSLRFNTDGTISLYRGDGVTLLGTTTAAFTVNVWGYVEIKAVIHDTAGSVVVRVNEAVQISLSGIDTRNAGAVGTIDNIFLARANTSRDDSYALDLTGPAPTNDFMGDMVVLTKLVSGNGDSSGWLGSDGNSVDNYQLVDEVNSSMTDYIAASVSGTTDLHALADIPTSYSVYAIQSVVMAVKSDAGTSPVVVPIAKGQNGTVRSDPALPTLSTTALSYASTIQTTDPDGNPLTAARVNAMQVGVKIQ